MEQVKTKRPDRRIAKTKKAICGAFCQLMARKEIGDITIKDIADLADVNRKTVYNYYGSTFDILDEIENNFIATYEIVLNDLDYSLNYKNTYKVFDTLSKVMQNDLEFYSNLMKMNTNVSLVYKIINYLKGKVTDAFIKQNIFKNNTITELAATYVVNGIVAAYKYWFTEAQNIPLDQFSQDVSNLVMNGISEFIKQ